MQNPEPSVSDIVHSIFREMTGDAASRLRGDSINRESKDLAGIALSSEHPELVAHDIAFHLLDWNAEAAFLVALQLFPDRFTPEQIREGVLNFLIHAPNHVAAAAKLGGWPVEDIFEVGALSGRVEYEPDLPQT